MPTSENLDEIKCEIKELNDDLKVITNIFKDYGTEDHWQTAIIENNNSDDSLWTKRRQFFQYSLKALVKHRDLLLDSKIKLLDIEIILLNLQALSLKNHG